MVKRLGIINVLIFGMMMIGAILSWLCIDDGHEMDTDDFALYMEQAKAILNGNLFELYFKNKFSMENSDSLIGPYLYPNGFPLLISFVYSIFGMNFIAIKMMCAGFFILSIPYVYKIFKNYFDEVYSPLFITLCIALNPGFITFSDKIYSDLPFFFFCMVGIYMMKKGNSIAEQVLLGVTISFSYFIRDVGIFLVPTLFVFQLFSLKAYNNFKEKYFFHLLPHLIFIAFFAFVHFFLPKGAANHFNIISNVTLDQIKSNFEPYILLISRDILSGNQFLIGMIPVALILLGGIIFLGMLASYRKAPHLIVFTLLLAGILIIWPFYQGIRFLFPLIPFIIFFSVKGLSLIFDWLKFRKNYYLGILGFFGLIIILLGFFLSLKFASKDSNDSYNEEMKVVYENIKKETPGGELIGFNKPRVMRLYTGYNSIYATYENYEKVQCNYILMHKADSITISNPKIFETDNYIYFLNDKKVK